MPDSLYMMIASDVSVTMADQIHGHSPPDTYLFHALLPTRW